MAHACAKPQKIEQLSGIILRLMTVLAANQGRHHHILQGCELRQKVMELEHEADTGIAEFRKPLGRQTVYIGIPYQDLARIGAIQASHNLQKRGLPGPGGPRDAHHRGILHLQTHRVKHLQMPETLGNILYTYHLNSYI